MSIAGHLDLTVDQGGTLRLRVEWDDEAGDPVTPAAPAVMEIRTGKGELLLRLTHSSGLSLNPGYIDVVVTDTQTEALPKGKHVFDLFAMKGATSDRIRLVEGTVTVRAKVSAR